MKIYLSHSRNFDFVNELYLPLQKSQLNTTYELIFPHEKSSKPFNTLELFQSGSCDVVVAEVSYSATGQGIELGWANLLNIPVVCMYKKGQDISGSLKVISNNFIEYTDQESMLQQLEESLEKFHKLLSQATFTPGVLVIKDDKVLLVRHGEKAGHLTGVYGLPCGHMEKGEKEKEAAVREFKEETGLDTSVDDLIEYTNNIFTADIPRKDGLTKRYTMKIFLCNTFSGQLLANPEATPEWIDIKKINTLQLLPNVKKAIDNGLKYMRS